MLEQLAPVPILVGSLCYAAYLFGTRAGRGQAGMQRAASLALVLSGLGLAILYWVTTGLGHDRDAATRFVLATILWGGLVLTISRQGTAAATQSRQPVPSAGSRTG
jgi:drug/metabolite transporter (DMT)-like permease